MKKILTIILALSLCAIACFGLTACKSTTYKDLGGETESFGIAFRKGSNITRKVEDAIAALEDEGVLADLAARYGVAGVTNYTPSAAVNEGSSDFASVQGKGEMFIGITDYKPMDYKNISIFISYVYY